MRLVIRFLQRLLILGLGIFTVSLIVFVIFRFADHRLPWSGGGGYVWGRGYIVLPRAIRMGLEILQRKSVPRFTITGDGSPGDPVNVVLMGTLKPASRRLRRSPAGPRPTGWASRARGAWRGPSYSTRPIRARHSAPSICSDAAKNRLPEGHR